MEIMMKECMWDIFKQVLAIELIIIRKQGVRKFALDVNKSNENAIKLYKKMGFEIEGTLKEEIFMGDFYDELVLMGKRVRNENVLS